MRSIACFSELGLPILREQGLRRFNSGSAVAVVGAGLVGLAIADALAADGHDVVLISATQPGEASPAAAGMLAPTVEPLADAALSFGLEARGRYPGYLRSLEGRTGIAVPLDRAGILELARESGRAARLRALASDELPWLDSAALRQMEPSLAPALGALLHPLDGAVDNVVLLSALERAAAAHARVRRISDTVTRIERVAGGAARLRLASGLQIEVQIVVLAAGAWSGRIEGLPRPLPVEPARGQMLAFETRPPPIHRVVFADDAYLVPRADGRTLVGATMERVGFDVRTTTDALDRLRRAGAALAPELAQARVAAVWAGLRPMTPDGLPVIGPDPEWPSFLYACGHSRNGILLAPLTADCIAALVRGEPPPASLAAFDIRRFASAERREPGRRRRAPGH